MLTKVLSNCWFGTMWVHNISESLACFQVQQWIFDYEPWTLALQPFSYSATFYPSRNNSNADRRQETGDRRLINLKKFRTGIDGKIKDTQDVSGVPVGSVLHYTAKRLPVKKHTSDNSLIRVETDVSAGRGICCSKGCKSNVEYSLGKITITYSFLPLK